MNNITRKSTTCSVYALHCGDGQYFYVGATSASQRVRMLNHLKYARDGHPSPVYAHIRSLDPATVQVAELEQVAEPCDLLQREADWIRRLISEGFDLKNVKSRDGIVDSMSAESRQKLSDARRARVDVWSAERRERVAQRAKDARASRAPKHGTQHEYRTHLCRCAPCSAANSAAKAAYRARRANLADAPD